MKRGIEVLIMWLVIAVVANFLAMNIPLSNLGWQVYLFTLISFPCAPWIYARHSDRVSPVICFGMIAGVLAILPFIDSRRTPMDMMLGREFFMCAVPVLMTLVCAGSLGLRRFLDRKDGH